MKKSELRQIIREEVRRASALNLAEGFLDKLKGMAAAKGMEMMVKAIKASDQQMWINLVPKVRIAIKYADDYTNNQNEDALDSLKSMAAKAPIGKPKDGSDIAFTVAKSFLQTVEAGKWNKQVSDKFKQIFALR